jgi:predicted RNase H-like HicB family nuclease
MEAMAGSDAGIQETASGGVPPPPAPKEKSQAMTQAYKVVIENDTRGGYVATFPEFADCKAQAESLKALIVRIGETMAPYADVGWPAATPDPGAPHRIART